MKKQLIKKNILEAKKKILKAVPDANKIDINVNQIEPLEYKTKISLVLQNHKNIITVKKDKSLKDSLEKSKHALIKRIKKIKKKKQKLSLKKLFA